MWPQWMFCGINDGTSCFESLRSWRSSGGFFFFSRAVLSSCCSTSYKVTHSPGVHHCSETLLKLLTCLDSLLQCSFSSRMDDLICSLDILNGFHWGKQMGKDSKLQQNYFNTEVDVCFSVLIHVYHVMFDMQYSVHLSHCLSFFPCYSPFAADRPCHRAAWCVSSAPLCSKANPAGVCAWQAKHKIDSMILILSWLSTSRTK